MKRIVHHPPATPGGRKLWRSLDELADNAEFHKWLDTEFQPGAAEFHDDGVSRRNFLRVMGASVALAGFGTAGCMRRPELELVPFNKAVEWSIPGKALFFATAMPSRKGAVPLVATTHDGRPTKLEGNPLLPGSSGGTDQFTQASVLDLYDPDRSRHFVEKGRLSDEDYFKAYLGELRDGAGKGEGLAFLVEENNSPTRDRLRAEIEKQHPQARWCVYEPLAGSTRRAARAAFGAGVTPAPKIDKADVIFSLDNDFLGLDGDLEHARAFAARRRVRAKGGKMNRLYVVEPRFTCTGSMADHRLRVRASDIGAATRALAQRIGAKANHPGLTAALQAFPPASAKVDETWIDVAAEDLLASRGKSLVLAGPYQPAAVQVLAHAINDALGNLNQTLTGRPAVRKEGVTIQQLAADIAANKVKTLFILGGNPVYNAPAELDWAGLQKSVENVVRLGLYEDETSALAGWHVPAAHYLESWADARTPDGTYVPVQPMILPLYGGWSELDVIGAVLGLEKTEGADLVQATFKQIAGEKDFEVSWNKFLRDGFLANSAPAETTLTPSITADSLSKDEWSAAGGGGDLELVLTQDAKLDDGRYANNGWLQEMPDPMTKLTWDNAALVSPTTAARLGIGTNDLIEIAVGPKKVAVPVLVAPGHADESLSVSLGYGRAQGRVATQAVGDSHRPVGVNFYPLRTSSAPYFQTGIKINKLRSGHLLAITQQHGSIEGRAIVREGTLADYDANPLFAKTMGMDAHIPNLVDGEPINLSLYEHPPLTSPFQWAMAIDLSTCTGCSACVVACQAENNIPVVGKEQVMNGRAMHWIRIDRYFSTLSKDDTDPGTMVQPMLCQHCEKAPCETVCPVNATAHSEDGLNVMVYNRCIGTRYCANNCPFKVRRFNFFDYNQRPLTALYEGPLTEKRGENSASAQSLRLQKNPNVTVRMRGVMEKCSFCIQRIQEAKIAAKVEAGATSDVRIPTDSFKVACQQACPSEAIVFGNVADTKSEVYKLKQLEQEYRVLEYLGIKPRVSYLARLKNPNMKMPDAERRFSWPVGHPEVPKPEHPGSRTI